MVGLMDGQPTCTDEGRFLRTQGAVTKIYIHIILTISLELLFFVVQNFVDTSKINKKTPSKIHTPIILAILSINSGALHHRLSTQTTPGPLDPSGGPHPPGALVVFWV